MDAISGNAANVLLGLGLPGVVILALLFAVVMLYRRNESIQDKRITEGREAITVMQSFTATTNNLIALITNTKKGS